MLRRTFLRVGTGGAALLGGLRAVPASAVPLGAGPLPSVNDPQYKSPVADVKAIPRFVNPLPRPPRIDLLEGGGARVAMAQTTQDIIGAGLGLKTPVWGYGPADGPGDGPARRGGAPRTGTRVTYPGPTVVARADRPVRLDWANELPFRHLLPVDTAIHWAYHGTRYTIEKQGVPTVTHLHGGHTEPAGDGHPDSWYAPAGARGQRFTGPECEYENTQEAATLWYHDHTMGLTRVNVYAGLAGFYLLRDDRELALIEDNRLPGGPYEREVIIQDRMFYPDGRLAYPDAPGASPHVPGVWADEGSEYFGRVIVVNGKAWPYFSVEPRQYRLRLLNGSNARFYRLSVGGKWPFPVTQIGTDGGFLHRPHRLDTSLVIAPAERVDLVVDFRDVAGKTFTLTNDAPSPYPNGTPVTSPTDSVLQIRVDRKYKRDTPEPRLPRSLREAPFKVGRPKTRTRRLLLFKTTDHGGRKMPMLGTVEKGKLAWLDPVTEKPRLNSTEVWEFYNTTADTHAVHLHLVQFQVVDRAPFTATQDRTTGALTNIAVGKSVPPGAGELGPKDTVQAPPGQVTRVKAFFDKRGVYVWHCHMLEHEDHEMMRTYEVV